MLWHRKISAQIWHPRAGQTDEKWIKPNRSAVKLNPSIPPGRPNRKVRAFSEEIARLVMNGYGCKAIHQALTDAGVLVSKSTVQREVARLTKPTPPAGKHEAGPPELRRAARPEFEAAAPPVTSRHQPFDHQQSGKEIAAAFMKGRITNPLLRNRS